MHAAIAGPSEKDPWALSSLGQRPLSPKLSGEDLSGVRIGYIELCANPRVAADVRTNTRACLAAWEAMGAEIEEVTDKIEEAVNTISGIDELRSTSSEGVSLVVVSFMALGVLIASDAFEPRPEPML